MEPMLLDNPLNRRSFWRGLVAVTAFAFVPASLAEADDADCTRRVRRIFVSHLGVEEKKVTMMADLVNDLGADSLDIVELVMAVEEEFSPLNISDDECEKLVTVGDWVSYLRR